jgi:hypothetical protein
MKEHDWNSLLQADIDIDEALERDSRAMEYVDRVTTAQVGSFLCRTLPQYHDILFSGGAPNYMQSYPKGVIVDAGASCGYALAQLRQLLPRAGMVANDVRNTPLSKFYDANAEYSVQAMFEQHQIYFCQGSLRKIPQMVPDGYDYLTSIVAFPDHTTSAPYQSHVIEQLYSGLRRNGIIQVLYEPTEQQLQDVLRFLKKKRIDVSFTPTSQEVLSRNFLASNGDYLSGTLTVGPK